MTSLHLRLGISSAVRHWAVYQCDKPAIVTDSRRISYRDLWRLIDQLSNDLHRLSTAGDSILVLCDDKVSYLASVIAAHASGRCPVLGNPLWDMETIGEVAGATASSIVVSERPNLTDLGCKIVHPGATSPNDVQSNRSPIPKSKSLDGPWGVFFSSGTTGRQKPIVRSELSVTNEMIGWILELPLTRSTHFYQGRPVFYTGGLFFCLSTLLVGATLVLPKEGSPEAFDRACKDAPIEFGFFVPDEIPALISFAEDKNDAFRKGTTAITMGSPIEAETKRKLVETTTLQYIESWGNTEGLGTITSPDDVFTRPESVGRPFITDSILIVDRGGSPVPARQVGRIVGEADSAFSHYVGMDDLTNEAVQGAKVSTTDLGFLDEEGFLYLVGRTDDVVETPNGTVIIPRLEKQCRALVRAHDFAIVPSSDGALWRVFVAGTVPVETQKQMVDLLTSLTGVHQDNITVVHEFALPKNAGGKLDRTMLRRQVDKEQ